MGDVMTKQDFIKSIESRFNVTVDDEYYASLSSLGIDRYDFEDFIYEFFGDSGCSIYYSDTTCLSDIYFNLISQ